ncbi:C40 family peptidase [Maribellus sediminis]|uniref:C40 family peptidase n=1 Tax=Maribellus sediminis TaxID=2696285 RepID=UPI001431C293|nr:C40 family peptidase [Maribellus sediminis]
MKNYFKILFIAFGVLLFACQQQTPKVTTQQIQEIQKEIIPDTRLEYFDVTVNNDERILHGATVSEPAFKKLQELAKENDYDFQVELLPEAVFKENPWGIVTLSVCNMRAKPDHAAELLTQALFGTPVKIYRKKGGWYLVQTPDRYFGWVDGAGISAKTNAEMLEWKKLPKVIYAEVSGFAYSEPKQNSGVESDLVLGNLLSVENEDKEYYKILYPDGREAFVKKNECVSTDQWNSKSFTIEDLLKTAFRFKGVPYLWGGTSPKMMDCSGFTKTAYYFNGLLLQRDASQQTLYGEEISVENGYENLEAGDLVFFGRKATEDRPERVTHVGLCIGDQKFIHESGKVRVNSLDATSEDYTEHYEKGYVRARRVMNNVDDKGIEWIVDNAFYKMVLPE